MTHRNLILLFLAMFFFTGIGTAQNITQPPSGGNQKASVSQWMGMVKAKFVYNSPDVTGPGGEDRSDKIWGELVPWGMLNLGFGPAEESPWRAGANENTIFSISHDVLIEGESLPAGKYGFHLIPQENGPWTIIFSSNSSSWGSYFYNPEEDVLRVEVVPEECEYTEWLSFGFDNRRLDGSAAYLMWEKMKVPFNIKVPNINDLYLAEIRNELRSSPGFSYLSWVQAANFCVQNNVNLDEALTWAETAISTPFIGQRNYQTLQTKAGVISAMGNQTEADAVMDEAIKDPTASVQDIHQYARSLVAVGRNERALEIFEYNHKAHPDDPFTTYVGLARGYAAVGNTKKAIKNWETAIKNLPENQKPNLAYYEAELKKLKE